MPLILVFAIFFVPLATPQDSTRGVGRTSTERRSFECDVVTPEATRRSHPGQIIDAKPRGDYIERSAVACSERIMRDGTRDPRDEAILSTLTAMGSTLSTTAEASTSHARETTWLVEVFYPNPEVATKVAFATKNALAERGLTVADRAPMLSVGDIDVITRLPAAEAYPTACRRFAETGTMRPDQTLLAIVSRDNRETALHAGLCHQGQWRWLR